MAFGTVIAEANAILAAKYRTTGFVAYQGPAGGPGGVALYYVQLHRGDPGAGGILLIANAAKPRIALGPMTSPANGQCQNANAVVFPSVSASETYGGVSLWTTPTIGTGVCKMTGVLVGSANIGDDFTIPAGQIVDDYITAG